MMMSGAVMAGPQHKFLMKTRAYPNTLNGCFPDWARTSRNADVTWRGVKSAWINHQRTLSFD
jgi:hypothetical protein